MIVCRARATATPHAGKLRVRISLDRLKYGGGCDLPEVVRFEIKDAAMCEFHVW